MGASMTAIRNAMQTALAGVGISSAALWTDQINPPCARIGPDTTIVDFQQTFEPGSDLYNMVVRLYVGRTSETAAQTTLDSFVSTGSATSVVNALEGTLSGLVAYLNVTLADNYGAQTVGAIDYLACDFHCEVQT